MNRMKITTSDLKPSDRVKRTERHGKKKERSVEVQV
jgi:hypothetical protein